jgi:4,5-DOPA dioxygenase extradiol
VIPSGPGIVYGVFAPNIPTLISPRAFGSTLRWFVVPSVAVVNGLRSLNISGRVAPQAIIVVTPHFVSAAGIQVQSSARLRCLHDFSGMPPELEEVEYSPPGHPALARALVAAMQERGIPSETTEAWGLDHGAWSALMHLVPSATIPVVPVSIADLDPVHFLQVGAALADGARASGVRAMVVGTGSLVHNFEFFRHSPGTGPWPEALRIESSILDLVLRGDLDHLLEFDPEAWAAVTPEGNAAPLFAVLGAMGEGYRAGLVSTSDRFGIGGLSTVQFLPPD